MPTRTCVFALAFLRVCGAFYVPISTSFSVNRVAKSIKLADSTVVVARNSTGHPVAFHDYCPHRGASFDNVVLKKDDVACPYHGFEFDTRDDGRLTRGLGVKPGCSRLRMIDCVERSGLVWACVDGDESVKPPPDLEQASDPTFRKIIGSTSITCPVNQLVSNVIDSCHISYVHSFGNSMDPEPIGYKAHRVSPTRGTATFEYRAGKGSMFDGALRVENWYDIPCTAGTSVRSGKDVKVVRAHAVQLTDGRTEIFWELYRNWATHPLLDIVFKTAMEITLDEDKHILESCSFDHGDKFNGKYDKLQIMYRRSMEKFGSL